MKSLITLLLISLFIINVNTVYSQWEKHPFELEEVSFKDIFFQSDHGWIVGTKGTILYSSDRGENWEQQNSPTGKRLNSVFFLDHNNGWAVGDSGTYLSTTDGGQTWNKEPFEFENDLYRVQYVDTSTGFISGKSLVIKTTNGGENWNKLIDRFDYYHGMYWIDENTGFIGKDTIDTITNDPRTAVHKTTDGGETWYINNYDEFLYWTVILEIKFKGDTGFAIGEDFQIWRTTNSGDSWTFLTEEDMYAANYHSIEFSGNNKIWAAGEGYLKFSSDGGENWEDQTLSENNVYDLFSIYFLDSTRGITVGEDYNYEESKIYGVIFTTDNGGVTSVKEENNKRPESLTLSCYPNPFNSTTNITVNLPESGHMEAAIYNLLGERIETIFSGKLRKGTHDFKYTDNKNSSGVYFIKIRTRDYQKTEKLLLIK